MEATQREASQLEDLIPPVELVELASFKTKSGTPFVVQVEPVRELELLAIVEQMPGLTPRLGLPAERDTAREVKNAMEYAVPLIEKAVSVRRADGAWQKPA